MRLLNRRTLTSIASVTFVGMLFAIGFMAASQSDPNEQLIAKGRLLFEETAADVGCASCHGHFAMGDIGIGPNIRGVDETRVRNALNSVEVMEFVKIALKDEDIKAVVAFLQYLGTLKPEKITREESKFDPKEITVLPSTKIQLILNNKDEEAGLSLKRAEKQEYVDSVTRLASSLGRDRFSLGRGSCGTAEL